MADKQSKEQSHSCLTDGVFRHGVRHPVSLDPSAISQGGRAESLCLQSDGGSDAVDKRLHKNIGDVHHSYPGDSLGKVLYESLLTESKLVDLARDPVVGHARETGL